ncbi:MAG: PEP-CTERM sorting domain-containing protein [Planctomycetales bacterium]|nr:PEP-CTERM sorting domain-containing protein [Planctomycetales bacterium]
MSRNWVNLFIVASCLLGSASQTSAAIHSPTPASAPNPDGVTLIYDPSSGELSIHAPDSVRFTAVELRSEGDLFTGVCTGLSSPFDVCTTSKVFKLDVKGFGETSFGNALPVGLTSDAIVNDLTIDGATLPNGFNVGTGVYLATVPEPATVSLVSFAVLGLLAALRRR